MTSRREFLRVTAALSAAPIAARAAVAGGAALDVASVVIDERFAAARLFGTRAQRSGVTLRPIKGDITALWVDALRPQWSTRPTPIAGLTARPALFCLEQLAWQYRMRVVYHAEHKPQSGGAMLHSVLIPAYGLTASRMDAAGAAWPGYTAGAISRLSATGSACGPSDACLEGAVGDDAFTLHSWVIAPVV